MEEEVSLRTNATCNTFQVVKERTKKCLVEIKTDILSVEETEDKVIIDTKGHLRQVMKILDYNDIEFTLNSKDATFIIIEKKQKNYTISYNKETWGFVLTKTFNF